MCENVFIEKDFVFLKGWRIEIHRLKEHLEFSHMQFVCSILNFYFLYVINVIDGVSLHMALVVEKDV